MKKNWEMAEADNAESIILATQRSFINMIRDVVGGIKEDLQAPGLTWEQIDMVLEMAAEKKPTIIHQDEPV